MRRNRPTRRAVLTSSAALATASALAPLAPTAVRAQADAELVRLQKARRIVLKGGIVLSLDPKVGDFVSGDVLIEDGKIREVRPNIDVSADAAVIVDASNRILIPGFVDTHSHSYQGLLRSSLPNGLVDPDYNRDVQNKWTPAYTPDDVYAGVLITALGFIDMGTTAIIDLSQISHTPEHSDACIKALQDAGIRAVYGYSRGAGAAMQWPQDIARLQKTYFSAKDQLLTLALGASLDAKVLAAAREAGVPAVMHYRVNPAPGLALAKAGVLREGDLFIHCTHLNDEAWRMIKDTGGRISMSPPLEMAMAHGMPSVQDALDRGIRPSLSSDHGTTVGQDCFSMMRTTFNLQRLRSLAAQERRREGHAAASHLPRRSRLRDATGCALRQYRQQGRHADARQGGRHPGAARRPDRHLAAQQRAERGGEFHESGARRECLHRREAQKVARQSGRHRCAARAAAGAGGA